MLQHKFSNAAKEDIAAIVHYTELVHDWDTYLRYQKLIPICIGNLKDNPQSIGVQCTHRSNIFRYHISYGKQQAKEADSQIKAPKHYIFFEVTEDGVLHILRVLHERKEFTNHL